MGKGVREKSKKLPEKLKHTRNHLNLKQDEMVQILFPNRSDRRGYISEYELGLREPPYPALVRLMKYLRVTLKIEIYIDDFVDDSRKLPF